MENEQKTGRLTHNHPERLTYIEIPPKWSIQKKKTLKMGGVLFESLLQSITSVEVYACLRPSRCLCAGLSRGGYDHQIVRADLKDDGGSGFRVLVLFSSGKWTDECSPKTKTHRKKPVATYLQVIGYKAYMIYIYICYPPPRGPTFQEVHA